MTCSWPPLIKVKLVPAPHGYRNLSLSGVISDRHGRSPVFIACFIGRGGEITNRNAEPQLQYSHQMPHCGRGCQPFFARTGLRFTVGIFRKAPETRKAAGCAYLQTGGGLIPWKNEDSGRGDPKRVPGDMRGGCRPEPV